MVTPKPSRAALPAAVVLALACALPVRAQSWELEVHLGGLAASRPTDGTVRLPPPGAPFVTRPGGPSRRESSWYFGDGVSLFNEVNARLGGNGRITALDPVLLSGLERPGGGDVGFRLGRRLNPRFGLELSLDYGLARMQMTRAGIDGIEASRASFITAWNGLLLTGPFTSASVTSTADIREKGPHPLLVTGALNVNLKTQGKLVPYLTVGGGIVRHPGDAPGATLTGNYRFRIAGLIPIDETDNVSVRYTNEGSWVGLFGVGFKYQLSARWGLRADVREHLGRHKTVTLVDARPVVAVLTPADSIASLTIPGIQFANNPSTGQLSSLSGTPLDGFTTFTGSGRESHLTFVGGVFLRF
jgi:hypothetical protein